jgi:O-antigen/teichoic acid export membrane protein
VIFFNYIWKVQHFFTKMAVPIFFNFLGAKILSPFEFGNAVYLLTTISVISIFSNFGISGSAMKIASESFHKSDKLTLSKVFSSSALITLSIIPMVLIIFFAVMWNQRYLLILTIPYIIFSPLTSILDGVYGGTLQFKRLAVYTFIPSIISLVASYYLINNYGVKGIMISYSLYYSLLFISYFLGYPYKKILFEKGISLKLLSYAVVLGFGSLAFFLYARIDIFILKKYNFINEIGYYEIVIRVFEILTIPFLILGQVSAPYFIKLKVSDQHSKMVSYCKLLPFIVILLGLVIAFVGKEILPYLVKQYYPEYYTNEFKTILFILLMTLPLKAAGVFISNGILTPLGYAKITSAVTLFFGIFNIILDFILIELYGFVGIFWATLFVHNLAIIMQFIFFYNKLRKDYVVVRI